MTCADQLLYNAAILTLDARNSVAPAMALAGERILAVGIEAKRMLGRTPGNIVAVRIDCSGVEGVAPNTALSAASPFSAIARGRRPPASCCCASWTRISVRLWLWRSA